MKQNETLKSEACGLKKKCMTVTPVFRGFLLVGVSKNHVRTLVSYIDYILLFLRPQ